MVCSKSLDLPYWVWLNCVRVCFPLGLTHLGSISKRRPNSIHQSVPRPPWSDGRFQMEQFACSENVIWPPSDQHLEEDESHVCNCGPVKAFRICHTWLSVLTGLTAPPLAIGRNEIKLHIFGLNQLQWSAATCIMGWARERPWHLIIAFW